MVVCIFVPYRLVFVVPLLHPGAELPIEFLAFGLDNEDVGKMIKPKNKAFLHRSNAKVDIRRPVPETWFSGPDVVSLNRFEVQAFGGIIFSHASPNN